MDEREPGPKKNYLLALMRKELIRRPTNSILILDPMAAFLMAALD